MFIFGLLFIHFFPYKALLIVKVIIKAILSRLNPLYKHSLSSKNNHENIQNKKESRFYSPGCKIRAQGRVDVLYRFCCIGILRWTFHIQSFFHLGLYAMNAKRKITKLKKFLNRFFKPFVILAYVIITLQKKREVLLTFNKPRSLIQF